MSDHTLSRRALLGTGLALSAGAVASNEAAEAEVLRGTLQGSLPAKVDVLVVGAGISGLVTAREIARAGRSVLVAEARGRVGGRVLNHPLVPAPVGSRVIESGGAFIGPTQNHIAALAAELGVATFPEYATGNSVYVSSRLGRLEYSGTVPPDPLVLPDAALLLQQLDQYAAEIDVDAPWAHPRAAEWDSMSLGQWLRANAVNPTGVENLIRAWTQPGFGADPDELSFLFVLWYVAASGDEENVGTFARNSDTVGGAQERRFVGGSQRVPLRMAGPLGEAVALRCAVQSLVQESTRVRVTTGRGTVLARRVVVAVPPSTAVDLHHTPNVPTDRRRLLRSLRMGQLMKCDAVYDTPFWRTSGLAGLSGFGISDSGATRAVFDNSPPGGSPGVLLAFVGGSTFRTYGAMPFEERKAAVLAGFAAMFGEQALHPVDFVEHDWTQERWSRGGPTAIHGPDGSFSTYGPAVRRAHGRVHWAGTETATYWSGYMDGAVSAGERAAAEVLRRLG